ncbi:alpha-ketoglutarate decarboxylase [Lacinutrix salivirga]
MTFYSSKISKKTLFSLILIIVFNFSFSQDDTPKAKSAFWENVRFGGGLGLSTGNGFFSATLAPSAIYQFDNAMALGVGLNGTYNSRKNVYNSTIFGASIISLYSPIREIQLSAEFEELNVSRKYKGNFATIEDENYWYPALFVGGGYRTNNITVGVRYDVLYDEERSIYANAWAPFVRVYF